MQLASYLSTCKTLIFEQRFEMITVFALRDCMSSTAGFNRRYSGVYVVRYFWKLPSCFLMTGWVIVDLRHHQIQCFICCLNC